MRAGFRSRVRVRAMGRSESRGRSRSRGSRGRGGRIIDRSPVLAARIAIGELYLNLTPPLHQG